MEQFSNTTLITEDGETYQSGDVLRITNLGGAFKDCTILGIGEPTDHGNVYLLLARPYLRVCGAGTTCPSALMGYETFEVPASKLGSYEKVDNGFTSMWNKDDASENDTVDLRPVLPPFGATVHVLCVPETTRCAVSQARIKRGEKAVRYKTGPDTFRYYKRDVLSNMKQLRVVHADDLLKASRHYHNGPLNVEMPYHGVCAVSGRRLSKGSLVVRLGEDVGYSANLMG
jgi:hypothetical protein